MKSWVKEIKRQQKMHKWAGQCHLADKSFDLAHEVAAKPILASTTVLCFTKIMRSTKNAHYNGN